MSSLAWKGKARAENPDPLDDDGGGDEDDLPGHGGSDGATSTTTTTTSTSVLNAMGDIDTSRPLDNSDIPPDGKCGDSVPFSALAALLEQISNEPGRTGKQALLSRFVLRWRENGKDDPSNTLFPVLRLMLPSFDRERGMYGVKDVTVGRYYCDILGIAKGSEDYIKLKNYTKPQHNRVAAGDFATVAFFVLQRRLADRPDNPLSITDVNKLLDALAKDYLQNNRAGVKDTLRTLLFRSTAKEQKWLIRIIGKDVKCGMSALTVLKAFHPDAVDLFNVCSNLRRVCWQLRDPSQRLHSSDVALFQPFKPMLAVREAIGKIAEKLGTFFMEVKFDGDRLMLHKQGSRYKWWSRKSIDYTEKYGSTPSAGNITPYIHSAFKSDVQDVILDGEMIVYDTELDCFIPKSGADVKSFTGTDKLRPCFIVFDIVFLNGVSLCGNTLTERLSTLRKVLTPISGRIMFADQRTGRTAQQIIDFVNEAIDNREEGVMVKDPLSKYIPDKRDGGWYKIKPEYGDGFAELDVLIVGGYFGIGKRRGGLVSHFMCAVAVPSKSPDVAPSVFHSFCKVGSGYSMRQLKELSESLEPHWRPFDTQNPPTKILLPPGFKEKPDVWIEPSKSRIVQIRAAEITPTDKYKCGYTLRFPRLECVRHDKNWADCMTTTELEHVYHLGQGRLTTAYFTDGDFGTGKRKKASAAAATSKARTVLAAFRGADLRGVKKDSDLFQGLCFYVINGSSERDKSALEKLIAKHGGDLVQNPPTSYSETCTAIVHSANVARVSNIQKTRVCDIVKPDWIDECVREGRIVPKRPMFVVYATPSTRAELARFFDEYGDSYIEDVSSEDLQRIFAAMDRPPASRAVKPEVAIKRETRRRANDHSDDESDDREAPVAVDAEYIAELEQEYFPNETQSIFRCYRFYVDRFANIQSPAKSKASVKSEYPLPSESPGSSLRGLKSSRERKGDGTAAAAAAAAAEGTPILGNRPDRLVHCSLDLTALTLVQHGAVLVDELDETVTHVVVHTEDLSRLPGLLLMRRQLSRKAHIVRSEWVEDCLREGYLMDERLYHPQFWTARQMHAAVADPSSPEPNVPVPVDVEVDARVAASTPVRLSSKRKAELDDDGGDSPMHAEKRFASSFDEFL